MSYQNETAIWPYQTVKVPSKKAKPSVRKTRKAIQARERAVVIAASKRPITGPEVSAMFGMSVTAGSHILSRLVRRGLIRKVGTRHFAKDVREPKEVVDQLLTEVEEAPAPKPAVGAYKEVDNIYREYCNDLGNFIAYLKARS